MSITRGNAEAYETDATTVSGRKMCIKITPTGYYRIDLEGAGDKLQLCEQIFTTLSEARKAVNAYVADNAKALAKEQFKNEMATKPSIKEQRKAERLAQSSGE